MGISEALGYRFKNDGLLKRALTHSSTEQPNNESLEFLGDTVLSTIISDYLYRNFPDATEGELTAWRSQVINNRKAIYSVATRIKLGDYINVGKSFPWDNHSAQRKLLSNTLEALIGAIYLDGGIKQARKFILRHFRPLLEEQSELQRINSKSRLQEYLQRRSKPLPQYTTVEVSGDKHLPRFTVSCSIKGHTESTTGTGGSIKEAEQNAAAKFYDLLCKRSH